jgi:hypothetical protein
MLRAKEANQAALGLGTQSEQNKAERQMETGINSKMQMWLSDLLLAKSGKAVSDQEFRRLASAIGMAPDWIERAAGGLAQAGVTVGGMIVGAVTGGLPGALAGSQAGNVVKDIVGDMSNSILNKPNKQEAVQGLASYLQEHRHKTEERAKQYLRTDSMQNPFGQSGEMPGQSDFILDMPPQRPSPRQSKSKRSRQETMDALIEENFGGKGGKGSSAPPANSDADRAAALKEFED